MLELLRASHGSQKILLMPDFKRDLRWFDKFLSKYNGISMYDHKRVEATLELDAGLTGFGGCCGNLVYHLPIQRGYNNWTIVHLEMVNILIAVRLFQRQVGSSYVVTMRQWFLSCELARLGIHILQHACATYGMR